MVLNLTMTFPQMLFISSSTVFTDTLNSIAHLYWMFSVQCVSIVVCLCFSNKMLKTGKLTNDRNLFLREVWRYKCPKLRHWLVGCLVKTLLSASKMVTYCWICPGEQAPISYRAECRWEREHKMISSIALHGTNPSNMRIKLLSLKHFPKDLAF